MTKDSTNSQGLILRVYPTIKHTITKSWSSCSGKFDCVQYRTLLVNLEVNSTQVSSCNCYFKHAYMCVCVDTETRISFYSHDAWYCLKHVLHSWTSRPTCNRELGFIDCSCLRTWMSVSFSSSPQDHTESLCCVLHGECSCVHLSHPLPEGNQHVREWTNTYVEVLCRNRRLFLS